MCSVVCDWSLSVVVRCIRVEYDLNYFGGGYSNVGNFVYVPLFSIDRVGLKNAFELATGYDSCHIIHYCYDEIYSLEGKLLPNEL
ncbi:MAG: hypothetical protein GY861_21545 [bacterium]|nr:hypothetical protein [bacterium]